MHLQIHVTDGDADGSNGVLQVAVANGWPTSNTDDGRQALDLACLPKPYWEDAHGKGREDEYRLEQKLGWKH